MSWFKRFIRKTEDVFRNAAGKPTIEQAKADREAANALQGSSSPAAMAPQGGEAYANAGDAVTNYQTKGAPGLYDPTKPKPVTQPGAAQIGGAGSPAA